MTTIIKKRFERIIIEFIAQAARLELTTTHLTHFEREFLEGLI